MARAPPATTVGGMELSSLSISVAAVGLAAWLMIQSGLQKRRLEWRFPQKRCLSCWHLQRDCRCRGH